MKLVLDDRNANDAVYDSPPEKDLGLLDTYSHLINLFTQLLELLCPC